MRRKKYQILAPLTMLAAVIIPHEGVIANSHYERGCDLYSVGRWVDAREEFIAAREELSSDDKLQLQRINYALSNCAVELEQKGADDRLAEFVKLHPESPYSNNISLLRGIFAAAEDEREEALEYLKEVNPDRLTAQEREEYYIRMGYLSFMEGDYVTAQYALGKISKDSKYYNHALYCNAYISYTKGEYSAAKSGFEELLSDGAYAPVAPYYLMQVEFHLGEYESSIEYGSKLLEGSIKQKQYEVVRTLAESYFKIGEYERSLALIDRYASLEGKMGREENYLKGFSLHQLGRYEEAIPELKRVCGADDEMTQNASFHLANCFIHTGDKDGARKAFSMAANDKFNPQIAEEALFNYAKLQYELGGGTFDESINMLTRYINTSNNAKRKNVAQTLLVAAYYNTRNYATAYDNIALVKNPDAEIRAAKQKITYLRGLEQYNDMNYTEAKRYLDESIKIGITPKQISLANYWLGEISFLEGDYDTSINKYNYLLARAPKSDPTTVEAQYSIAYSLIMKGRNDEALQYFQRFVDTKDINPMMRADAYNRMGDIYYGKRNFGQATKCYQKVVWSRCELSNYARLQMAMIEGIQGNMSAKISTLKNVNKVSDGEAYLDDALFELGLTYIKSERYKEAITSLQRLLEEYPSTPFTGRALASLGVAYINLGDSRQALKYYDEAIKAAPQSEIAKDAMLGVREIYIGEGRADDYFEYVESIGMEGDLSVVARDSLSFASARGLYVAAEGSKSKQQSASEALKSYVKSYPKGYYLSDALFFLADSYLKAEDATNAIETLEALSERGNSQYSERVYEILSKITYDEGLYEKSAKASHKLFETTKDSKVQIEAMGRYMDATILWGDEKEVEMVCDEVLLLGKERTGEGATTKALYSKATILRERGEREAALKYYAQLAEGESEYRSESKFYIIDDNYRAGKSDVAETMIFDLAESEGIDPYWLARSFMLLGDIYVAREDSFQARATYQSIVDGYSNMSDGIIEEATKKISELK